MSIYLNDVKIPGHEQKVSANLTLAYVDMSGHSSYTPQAETGDKPKSLSILTKVRFADDSQLTQIITLAEAKNASGERMVYNIINNTAQAMNIRQVHFSGDVQVREDAKLELWIVTFKLIEYHSIPEIKEQREEVKKISEQVPEGIPTGEAVTAQQVEQAVELTQFEQTLKWVNDKLE